MWNDYLIFNKDKPFAFNLDTETIILVHHNCDEAFEMVRLSKQIFDSILLTILIT